MGRKTAWSTGLALALASSVLLSLLGHKLLTDWDEGIYAEVSREMLGHSWLVPHWNGQLWFEKPPMMLWITAALFRIFGVTEFWARAGSALSGIAIIGVLHGWAARREGLVAAWTGTVALLSTAGFLHICRVGEMDALLSLGCVVALIGITAVASGRTRGWYGFWMGFAVAAMTKGSASVVLPLAVGVLAVVERWAWRRFGLEFWLGLAGFAALVLPWHLAMWHLYGATFLREYFGFHVLTRATQAIEGHRTPWWFYGKVLLVSAMPWVLVFPVAAWRAWRKVEVRASTVFTVVVVVFFSFVQTRLPHYVAPVYPAMAVVLAGFLAESVGLIAKLTARRRMTVAAVAAVVWGGGLMLTAGGRKRLHSAPAAGGWTTAEEREAIGLLRGVEEGGPVLVWWTEPRRSVAASVFYSQREVRLVRAAAVDSVIDRAIVQERYTSAVGSLDELVGEQPTAILLETKLISEIPGELVYSRIRAGPTIETGTICRKNTQVAITDDNQKSKGSKRAAVAPATPPSGTDRR